MAQEGITIIVIVVRCALEGRTTAPVGATGRPYFGRGIVQGLELCWRPLGHNVQRATTGYPEPRDSISATTCDDGQKGKQYICATGVRP